MSKIYHLFLLLILLCFSCQEKQQEVQQEEEFYFLINSLGDTIPTGVPVPVKGKVVDPENMSKVEAKPFTGPYEVVSIPKNSYTARNPVVIKIPKELNVITPGKDSVPLPKTVPIQGKIVPALQPKTIPALPPRYKDDATINIKYLDVGNGLRSSFIPAILEDSRGNIWFGTDNGLSRYDGQSFAHFTEKEGMVIQGVHSILEDSKNNLWFGSLDGWVTRYDGHYFTHFQLKEGLTGTSVSGIQEDKNGHLWFLTGDRSVSKLVLDQEKGEKKNHGMITYYTEKEGLDRFASIFMADSRGNLWFSVMGKGVKCWDGQSFTQYTTKEGLSGDYVVSIFEDKKGNIWFGTNGGISKLEYGETGNRPQLF